MNSPGTSGHSDRTVCFDLSVITPYLISQSMSALNIKDLLLAPQLDRQTADQLLAPFGFKDTAKADANLQAAAADPSERPLLAEILEELLVCGSQSADPDQAVTYFERFVRSGLSKAQLFSYLHTSPKALEILLRSLGGSTYMAEILIRDPQLFYWVTDSEILRRPRTKREIQREIVRTAKVLGTEQQQLDYLRFLKRREMLHIGVRDLLRLSSVEETWTALSALAEALISSTVWICAVALRREYGITGRALTGFTVLAMGKLGGGELNFSSDVDLMYLYATQTEEAGGISAPDYFRRLAQKITLGLSNLTGEGYIYRVDLRLRPEGKAGNLADSLEGFKRYYQTRLAAWERLALTKAWPVAGDRALGAAFLVMARQYVYGPAFGGDGIRDILDMKRRMDERIATRGQTSRNVKLGTGGIREIELVAQSLQTCYGSRSPQIRERNTMRALKALCEQSFLSNEEYESLSSAYVFLRDVENKLQMVHDRQTHSLPVEEDELAACASLLGYIKDEEAGPPVARFLQDYRYHTGHVNRIFGEILGGQDFQRFSR
jgi:[glutamine synthetase] adenylyltransferase / [glutamine synthetase]-adenylyl-L-tyrosine phosphorylase